MLGFLYQEDRHYLSPHRLKAAGHAISHGRAHSKYRASHGTGDIPISAEGWVPALCDDNKQTIRLVTAQVPHLVTKLKHIDIQHYRLRQEVSKKTIQIEWVLTAEMLADGLTKALLRQKHEIFIKQLGLVDIAKLLQ
jgi:inner membrane protein involved in colicin E2 resistance